ncbi:MAG: ribosome-associated protein [Myxococcota bacterium]|jgi:ribosome-associated protein
MGRKKKQTSHQWVRPDLQEPEPEDDGEDHKSRTQLRNEARALDDLAETLVKIPKARLARLPLSDELREALALAKRITSHEATRRQNQFIGRLLRTEPVDIAAALEDNEQAARARDRSLGRWCKRILAEGEPAIADFLTDHPLATRKRLRQLWRIASRDPGTRDGELLSYLYEVVPPA